MSWEARLLHLFDDLEQEAEGLALSARDAEVAELSRAQYAEVDLGARLHAALGRSVEFELVGAGPVAGRLSRVGRGWALVDPAGMTGQEWVVNLSALVTVRGLSGRATVEAARGIGTRVGIGSALRRIAEARDPVVLAAVDGSVRRGRLAKVGADFIELVDDAGDPQLLPFSGLAVIRPG